MYELNNANPNHPDKPTGNRRTQKYYHSGFEPPWPSDWRHPESRDLRSIYEWTTFNEEYFEEVSRILGETDD